MAHVDRVSPLDLRPGRPTPYSFPRAAFHNLAGMVEDTLNVLRGRAGDHRCELDCEWTGGPGTETGEADRGPLEDNLLDPADHQWSVQAELRVQGHIDEQRLRKVAAGVFSTRPCTHDLIDAVAASDSTPDRWRADLHSNPARPDDWPPLRVRIVHDPGGDWLMLGVNHAAGDGVAAMELLDRLARAYAHPASTQPPVDFLAVRDIAVRPSSISGRPPWHHYTRRLTSRLRNLPSSPTTLAADDPSERVGCGYAHTVIDLANAGGQFGKDRPATTRVLVGALHMAIATWSQALGVVDRRIGVLAPVDLRLPEWDRDRVANLSVTARILTAPPQRLSPRAVWRSVNAQAIRTKRFRIGVSLIAALDRSELLDLWARQSRVVLQPATANRRLDAAMVADLRSLPTTDLGGEAGPVTEVWVSVPTRTPLSVSVGAVTVGDDLHLTLRYPLCLWSADAARRFLGVYVTEIGSVVDAAF